MMKITSSQAWWVQIPIELEQQHVSDFGRLRTFDAAILRLETDDGLIGWGEAKNAAGSAGKCCIWGLVEPFTAYQNHYASEYQFLASHLTTFWCRFG